MLRAEARYVVLAALLVGCKSSSPVTEVAPQLTPGTVLFFDEFNRTTGMGAAWAVPRGSFSTDGTSARGTATSSYAFWVGQPDVDGTVEVKLAKPVGTYLGILTRANVSAPDRDHYAAYLDPDGRVGLARRSSYEYSYLASGPLVTSGSHVLGLRAVGSGPVDLSVTLDGKEVIHAVDASAGALVTGRVGQFDYAGKAQPLDDFTVIVGSPSGGTAADAGVADAAATVDASVIDLSVVDARVVDLSVVDARVVDLSVVDARVVDLSVVDARVVDSGTGGGGSSMLFFDDFQRSGPLGSSWSVAHGTFSTTGSVATGTAPSSYAFWTGQPDPNGPVSIQLLSPLASTYSGVVARANPTAPDRDHYVAYLQPDGVVGLARRDSYDYSYLGTGPKVGAGSHELSLTASGSQPVVLSVKVDGVEVIHASDNASSARSSGLVGMFDYQGGHQALDQFTVRSTGGAPADAGTGAVDAGLPGGGDASVVTPDLGGPTGGSNPVSLENAKPGNSDWKLTSATSTNDLSGYFSTDSAAAGETVTGFVHSASQATVTWRLYRIGWYGGAGGRKVAEGQLTARPQPTCPKDGSTGLVECLWSASFSFQVQSDWLSGVYVAKLTRSDGTQALMILTVRDGRTAAVMVQQSVTTWQAYNEYRGESLYGTQLGLPQGHAVKVSLARPYDEPAGQFLDFEVDFVHWVEAEGFDATYVTNLDFVRAPDTAQRAKVFLSVGHDEYWTSAERDALERARDRGVWQGYFSADTALLQIRTEAGVNGPLGRIVCYKDTSDPLGATSQATVRYRDPPVLRPENGLRGVMSDSWNPINVPLAVELPDHWLFAGTGLKAGDTIAQVVGYEVDRTFDNGATPAGIIRLGGHPVVDVSGGPNRHDFTIYTAPSGATVFSGGTIQWGWGLGAAGVADARLQRITSNFLRAGGAAPATGGSAPAGSNAWSRADVTGASSSVTTVAGVPGTHGAKDGAATAATFDRPSAVAVATDGTIYVADAATHRIRSIRNGVVSTLAGDVAGAANGTGTTARFRGPQGLTLGPGGALYVADTANHCIRMVTTTGVVSTLAGSCGSSGLSNGNGGAARFRSPQAIAVGPSGALYVADTRNNAIRKIVSGNVTTLAASPGGDRSVFHMPNGLAVGSDESVYVIDSGHRAIKRVSTSGVVSTVLSPTPNAAPYRFPDYTGGGFNEGDTSQALAMPAHGLVAIGSVLYFSDAGNERIRRLDLGSARVTTFAGSGRARCEDGAGASAGFQYPQGLAQGGGALYVADSCGAVRRIALP